jgi:type VI secretion system secreted protein Hcp
MAFDAFIKIDGIKGEAMDLKHKEEIEVFSYTWGVSQAGSSSSGSGAGAGKCQISDFSFVKRYDRGSPILFMKCCTGEHIKEASFTIRKAGGEQVEFIKMKFVDLVLTKVDTGGSGSDEIPMETVNFTFTQCYIDYQEQGQDGKPKGGPVHGGWDMKVNKTV